MLYRVCMVHTSDQFLAFSVRYKVVCRVAQQLKGMAVCVTGTHCVHTMPIADSATQKIIDQISGHTLVGVHLCQLTCQQWMQTDTLQEMSP